MLQNFKAINEFRCILGEAPIYDDRCDSFLYVDIKTNYLYKYNLKTQITQCFKTPKLTSACLLSTLDEVYLLVSQDGLFILDSQKNILTHYCAFSFVNVRPNECQVLSDGLYISAMNVNAQKNGGALYKFNNKLLKLELLIDNLNVPNTLVEDDNYIYFHDSLAHKYYHLDKKSRQIHQHIGPQKGILDGSCILSDHTILNANWALGRIDHYKISPEGLSLIQSMPVPLTQPSSVALGGIALNKLLITSAADGLNKPAPLDGAALIVQTDFTGQKYKRFNLGDKNE